MTSSVDSDLEVDAIVARLDALKTTTGPETGKGECRESYPQGFEHPVDAFGRKLPYREFETGSVIPSAGERMLAAGEQAQPHVWAFQVHHYAPTRKLARKLATETDKSLMGWAPSTNATPISTFFFTMYDEFNKDGEHVGFIATRFYETVLGQSPDLSL
jgi:hypothetical protein